jgi:hypothetical protein
METEAGGPRKKVLLEDRKERKRELCDRSMG